MPAFSEYSRERLLTCDPRIIRVMREAIKVVDFRVLCGHRSNEEQDALYAKGRTEPGPIVTYKKGGESIHNHLPSRAIDVVPWPIDWDDRARFGKVAGVILAIAWSMDIPLEWGYDLWGWDEGHFQLRV